MIPRALLPTCLCALLLAACGSTDTYIEDASPGPEARVVDSCASPEELYFEVVRLRSRDLLSAQSFDRLQRSLDEMEQRARTPEERVDLYRYTLISSLRRTLTELNSSERAAEVEAELQWRGYAREWNRVGVRQADRYAEGTVVLAGVVGIPTSKGDLVLIVATAGGGYLVVKIAKAALRKTPLFFRKMKSAAEVAGWARHARQEVQHVTDINQLRRMVGEESTSVVSKMPRLQERPTGAVGPHSRRPFEPGKAGGPVQRLSYEQVRITERGVDVVEAHLRRFDPPGKEELKMVERLRRIARGELEPDAVDLRFYTHELREYVRYRRNGYPAGEPPDADEAYGLWNDAHTATLEDYGLREGPGVLIHPEVKQGR